MSQQFVGEVRPFAFNFAPHGWAFCDGQVLPIAQYTALFQIVKNYYGGDGVTTFALPNLQQRAPIGFGRAPGLSNYTLGEQVGVSDVALTVAQMPQHSHPFSGQSPTAANQVVAHPGPTVELGRVAANNALVSGYNATQTQPVTLNGLSIEQVGSGMPHNNMQPCLTINFCIALEGIYPAHSG